MPITSPRSSRRKAASYPAKGARILAAEEQRRRAVLERSLAYCRAESAVMQGAERLIDAIDTSLERLRAIPMPNFSASE